MDAACDGQGLPSRQLKFSPVRGRHWVAWCGTEVVARAVSFEELFEICEQMNVTPERCGLEWRPLADNDVPPKQPIDNDAPFPEDGSLTTHFTLTPLHHQFQVHVGE